MAELTPERLTEIEHDAQFAISADAALELLAEVRRLRARVAELEKATTGRLIGADDLNDMSDEEALEALGWTGEAGSAVTR